MNILKPLKKFGFNLFLYFAKGARIDAALQFVISSRIATGRAHPKPGSKPLEQSNDSILFDGRDMMTEMRMTTKASLILKNNSKNYAYNIKLLNAEEVFDSCERIPKLSSLSPNESLTLKVEFVQIVYVYFGMETDNFPYIPTEKENKILKIQYENEAGTKFITKFWVSLTNTYNEHTYS
jgi:hypothetical protein